MMKRVEKKEERVEESKNQIVSANNQHDVDLEIREHMQKRKEEKEALKKLLFNLNEPITNKRKQPK
jgi:hypothetical protein